MAQIPKVNVYMREKSSTNSQGMASKIACIGAFNSEETTPILTKNLNDAYTKMGGNSADFNGNACLEYLYTGASSVLCVNITTWSGEGSEKTPTKTLTTAGLTAALAKIKGEDWDILFVADNITDEALPIIDTFLNETFEMKFPAGYILGLTRANASAYTTTAGLMGEHSYGVLTQSLTYKGNTLSIVNSAAYYAGLIAGLNIGNTMTMKQLPNIEGVTPEYTFETGDLGTALVGAGFTTARCLDRENKKYVVVNSEQPNGLDLYINRVRDYIIKQFSLHQFLGNRNRSASLNEIKQEIERVKNICINVLDLLEDIEFTVEKKDANCVDIYISRLLFDGIITTIDVYVTLDIE